MRFVFMVIITCLMGGNWAAAQDSTPQTQYDDGIIRCMKWAAASLQ